MKKYSIKKVMRRQYALNNYLDAIVKSKKALTKLKKIKVYRN